MRKNEGFAAECIKCGTRRTVSLLRKYAVKSICVCGEKEAFITIPCIGNKTTIKTGIRTN